MDIVKNPARGIHPPRPGKTQNGGQTVSHSNDNAPASDVKSEMPASSAASGLDRILRQSQVLGLTGLSRSTIWRRVQSGDFPKPVRLSSAAVGWRESELAAWMDSLPRA